MLTYVLSLCIFCQRLVEYHVLSAQVCVILFLPVYTNCTNLKES
jgi:hypothetical protein